MRSRLRNVARLVFLSALFVPAVVVTSGDRPGEVQEAIVNLMEPTRIGDAILMGPVVFVHDDRMYTGEPCTSVYRFEPGVGARELLTMFVCEARKAPVVKEFTLRTDRDPMFGCVRLMEYQFAGDSEAHGVPTKPE